MCCVTGSFLFRCFQYVLYQAPIYSPQTVAAGVYLRPGETVGDAKSLFEQLDQVVSSCTSYLVLRNFNIKSMDWSLPNLPSYGVISGELVQMLEHNIRQLNTEPSRESNTLDFVLFSSNLPDSEIHQLPPFADHMEKKIYVICQLIAIRQLAEN